MSQNNPCLSCGACCSSFRVSFYWGETNPTTPEGIPPELTEPINQFYSCMKGTNNSMPRCIALEGTVGQAVSCQIYQQRSSTCQEFNIVDDNGKLNPQCTKARAKHGLLPVVFISEE